MRKHDYYYCYGCDTSKTKETTYIDDNRFIRCDDCLTRVYVMTDSED